MATVSVRYIVTDVRAAADFYATRLKFTIKMIPNEQFAMLLRDDLRLMLVKPSGPGGPAGGGAAMPDGTTQQPGGWNRFSIEVPDIEAVVRDLRESGTRFRNDVVNGVGGRQIILEDPSGNPVELFEPVRPEARTASL